MDASAIKKLAELIDDLGQAGRSGAEALAKELATYPDRTNIDEGLGWLADLPEA